MENIFLKGSFLIFFKKCCFFRVFSEFQSSSVIHNADVNVNSKPADNQVERQQVNIVPDSITITEDTDSKDKDTDEISCSKDKDKDRIACVKPVSLELTDGWYLYYNLFMY